MYTKREILDKIEGGDTEEANDILLDFIEKLFAANNAANKDEFYELKDEWNCDLEIPVDLKEPNDFDWNWNFFEKQSIDFVVEDDY